PTEALEPVSADEGATGESPEPVSEGAAAESLEPLSADESAAAESLEPVGADEGAAGERLEPLSAGAVAESVEPVSTDEGAAVELAGADSSAQKSVTETLSAAAPAQPLSETAPAQPQPAAEVSTELYTCPMDPEVTSAGPGSCPKCGMALEPVAPHQTVSSVRVQRIEYVCPMHPDVVASAPGICPRCGMALELRVHTGDQENPELNNMVRRLRISLALTIPVFFIGMWPMLTGSPLGSSTLLNWIELLFTTPVVLWAGWPFFQRGWASIVNKSLNMFTLIATGTGVAYFYSVAATVMPDIFPESFRMNGEAPAVYFESAAVITTLVLLGQVLELRARSRTSSAIQSLMWLTPKQARILRADGSEEDVSIEHVTVGDHL